jgi:hypothetical protein
MFEFIETAQKAINGKPTLARLYRNKQTGTELFTYLLYTDKDKRQWWTFEDLFTLPFIRQLAAKKIIDLYGHGLALTDIKGYTTQIKEVLRSNHSEKYEMAYAKILEMENLTETMADPVKQCIGLCTVYVLLGDERPDAYVQAEQNIKMSALALDIDAQAFFLHWWTDIMRRYGKLLKGISGIASTIPPK